MNRTELIARAKEKELKNRVERETPHYKRTMAWLGYLGLLKHNKIKPKRYNDLTLAEALLAAKVEPRVSELLPAIMVLMPEALKFTLNDVPRDLKLVVKAIKARTTLPVYCGIDPVDYMRWLYSSILPIAKRRVEFKKKPRRRLPTGTDIGQFVKRKRLELVLTQLEFAQTYDLPLRVVRDLEQGKLSASIANVNRILKVFGRQLAPR
jgi:DNA-binding transcriptional regulator YiaG